MNRRIFDIDGGVVVVHLVAHPSKSTTLNPSGLSMEGSSCQTYHHEILVLGFLEEVPDLWEDDCVSFI